MDFSDDENDYMPEFSFDDKNGRGKIKKQPIISRFRPGDDVYLKTRDGKLEGPFKIESVAEPQKYTLSDRNGNSAKEGSLIQEQSLICA